MADHRPHLHELLAVEQEKKANAERARSQTLETFRANQAHFTGMRRTFKPFAVDEAKGEVAGERLEAETHLVKTVAEELERLEVGHHDHTAPRLALAMCRTDLVRGRPVAGRLPDK